MDPKIQDTLNEGLKTVLAGLQAGADFAREQLPLVCQEKLAYDFYYYVFFTGMWLAAALIAGVWAYSWHKAARREGHPDFLAAAYFPAGMVWAATVCALGNNVPNMIQIYFAPRLYLMEWLLSMVKH